MNRIINLTLKEDKSFTSKKFKLGNKFENNTTKIIFEIPAIFESLTKRYVVFQNPNQDRQFALPLAADNSFILSTIVSQEAGNWSLLLLLKENDLDDDLTDETEEEIVVTDIITGSIADNYIEDSDINPEDDPNLSVFYEDLEKQIEYLSSKEFAELIAGHLDNGATFTPHVDELGNLSWTNNRGLDNPETVNIMGPEGQAGPKGDPLTYEDLTEEQKESLKGESGKDGENGKSAYQIWLDEGNTGTEEDFLNSLKGKDGTMTFEDLTEEQKESLKGESGKDGENGKSAYQSWLDLGNEGTEEDFINSLRGEDGAAGLDGLDGKSAYEVYSSNFEYKNIDFGDKVGGRKLKITNELKGWNVRLACNNWDDLCLVLVINENEEYIQDEKTGEVFSFDSNREVVVPEKFTYLNSCVFQTYPSDINIFNFKIGELISVKNNGEVLSEDAWLDSLKGETGKSSYDLYLDTFNFKPLVIEELKGGNTLKITDDRTEWEGRLFLNGNTYYKYVISDTEKYIQFTHSNLTGDKIYFNDNGEVEIPKTDVVYLNGEIYDTFEISYFSFFSFETYPSDINFIEKSQKEVLSELFSFKETGEPLSENLWIDSLEGESGEEGATFIPSVDEDGNLSWTNNKGLANPETINIKGPTGQNGNNGVRGAVFTPSVDTNGNLSWTNDGGYTNPATVNIMGPSGSNGQDGKTPERGTDYWTSEDITTIENYCKNYIDTELLGGAS